MAMNVELREKLIEKINSNNNAELLAELLSLIDFESKTDEVYKLSAE